MKFYSILLVSLLFFSCDSRGQQINTAAPGFANQVSPEGDTVHLDDFRGKYLLIDFWASWCTPCRAENLITAKIYSHYKSTNFEILGISLDRKKAEWTNAITHDKVSWKQASDLKFWDNECVKLYGLNELPYNILIDPKGKVVAINLHGDELSNQLDKLLR